MGVLKGKGQELMAKAQSCIPKISLFINQALQAVNDLPAQVQGQLTTALKTAQSTATKAKSQAMKVAASMSNSDASGSTGEEAEAENGAPDATE